jgi:hypothetical protein
LYLKVSRNPVKKTKFNQLYEQITENITTDSAGVGATQPSTAQSGDTYAPGDARTPKVLGGKKAKIIRRPFPKAL